MAFRRRDEVPDPDHPEPVEIDLGVMLEWQVQPVLAALTAQGFRMQVYSQSIAPQHGGPRHHRILVHADDVDAVRAELVEAELL